MDSMIDMEQYTSQELRAIAAECIEEAAHRDQQTAEEAAAEAAANMDGYGAGYAD